MKLKSFMKDRLYFIFYTVLLVSLLIIAYALAVLEAGNHIFGFKYHLFNYSGVIYDAIIKKYWVNC